MTKAVFMDTYGGPEVLKWRDYNLGKPGPGEVLLSQEAIGVNFIDIYQRSGLYPLPAFPAIIRMEGAGIVEAVGDGATEVIVGDRVAYAGNPPGAYAEMRLIPAHRLVRLPESISFRQAAGMMLRGMTARYLLHGCYPVTAESRILIHAAAGGVGSIVSQWAAHIGATVIGTVGSSEKAEIAKANGCEFTIDYNREDFVQKVKEITAGKGVDVVYDSVGRATFMKSLDCLRPKGTLVSFGQSSGNVGPIEVGVLGQKGSLFLTRPSLISYTENRDDLLQHAGDLFKVVESGVVKIAVNQTYRLQEAAKAHRDLEARRTTGSTVLIP